MNWLVCAWGWRWRLLSQDIDIDDWKKRPRPSSGQAQAQAALSLSRHQPGSGSGGAAHVPVVLQVFAPCLQTLQHWPLCCSARCLGQTTCQMIVIPPARSLSCSNINYSAPPCQPSPGAGALKPLSLASLCSLQHCSTKPPLTLTSCVQIFANNSWCPPSLPAILDQVLPASLAAKVHGKPPRATGLVCVSQPCVIQETLPSRGGGTFSIIIFRRGPKRLPYIEVLT